MFKNLKISLKIFLVIVVISFGTMLTIAIASYFVMDTMLEVYKDAGESMVVEYSDAIKSWTLRHYDNYLQEIVTKQAETEDARLYAVNRIITEASDYLHRVYVDGDNFTGKRILKPYETANGMACARYQLAKGVEETPELMDEVSIISNCEYMFAPLQQHNDSIYSIYIGSNSGISYSYSRSNDYNENFDPREREWYKQAIASPDTVIWLPTYIDVNGNTCITAASTYRGADGNVAGVVAADILIDDLIKGLTSLKIGDRGSCFIIDNEFNYIAHQSMNSIEFDQDIRNHFSGNEFFNAVLENDDGIVDTSYDGMDSYVAFTTMEEPGWIFCGVLIKEDVLQPVDEVNDVADDINDHIQSMIMDKLLTLSEMSIVCLIIMGIITIFLASAVSHTVTSPIKNLASGVALIGKGEFDQKLTVDSKDEIGQLADKFNTMQDDLKDYMENIKLATAEKERITAELSVATEIQEDMLPRKFPPFPERNEFDIYAAMDPAKEVGGDFYDIFLADDNHLALVMADVSGKGVPAALFMVIAKTLIKNVSQSNGTHSPAEIIHEVNNKLCEGNDANFFVTVWLCIIEISTGKAMVSNAGHEHPAMKRRGGEYELIVYQHSPAVGIMEDLEYEEHEVVLSPGDSIFVYTDGVAEANGEDEEQFGTDRMIASLNASKDLSAKEIVTNVGQSIEEFVGGRPQFDDITMLAITWLGNEE